MKNSHIKNSDDLMLLERKRRIDRERRLKAEMRNRARAARAAAAMAAMADPSLRPMRKQAQS